MTPRSTFKISYRFSATFKSAKQFLPFCTACFCSVGMVTRTLLFLSFYMSKEDNQITIRVYIRELLSCGSEVDMGQHSRY